MKWFSKNKSDENAEGSIGANASSPQRPLKGTISSDGCLICPACGGESVAKVSEIRRWMQEQKLDTVICMKCGAFLMPS